MSAVIRAERIECNEEKQSYPPRQQSQKAEPPEKARSTLPPRDMRTKPINAYKKPSPKASFNYSDMNLTLSRFLNDPYTIIYFKKCHPDFDQFTNLYLHYITSLDNAYNFLSDQKETMAFEPSQLCQILNAVYSGSGFGNKLMVKPKWFRGENKFTWKYVKKIAKYARIEWDDYYDNFREYSEEAVLWRYFKTWFLDILLGSIFVERAEKIKKRFEFSMTEARSTDERPLYPSWNGDVEEFESAFDVLHQAEKQFVANKKKNKNNFKHKSAVNALSPRKCTQSEALSTIDERRETKGQYENDDNDQNDGDDYKNSYHSAVANSPPQYATSESVYAASEAISIIGKRRETKGQSEKAESEKSFP